MNVLVGVISHAAAWVLPRSFIDDLRREFPQHTFVDAWDVDAIRRLIPDADVAFVPHVDREMLASAPRLRWIQSPAVGVAAMLYPEMLASSMAITTARGVRARAIAEHVIGVTIALFKQFHVALRRQAEHVWAQDELEGRTTAILPLRGRRMGIVGLGSIGVETARLASACGLRVIAIRRRVDATKPDELEAVLPPDRLHDLLAASDVVVLAASQSPATDRLIGRRELAAMKPEAFLVNVSRGTLVDDEALVSALKTGRIAGAALDVFTHEPLDSASPYWDLPNVIVTPHTSGAMADHWPALIALFSENLRRFDAGRPLLNVVDKEAGY